ncbi:winged helix-turn-helix transcriptional regulator [Spiractinospora alimapuensis]|uniref:ArsR/SmtB family transcription factor n=1 Tax=Spiractinospora alimapuensis TaxID=2820884 RepID=UPI001F3721F6|nr:metalloregulator ArsR/SmtB family transcription factor [Spiractinospora alimapuensis]QVQ54549.1 winged helix-turn-helix transcriptional regulator [Spiractinospora alimapuensis]
MTDSPQLTTTFAALADETRWAVLQRVGRSPASASELSQEFPVSRQAIVKHLDVLREVGLVEADRHGRAVVFHAVGARLNELGHDLRRMAAVWDRRLAAIKRSAEAPD